MDGEQTTLSRRGLLRAATGTAVVAGASGRAAAQEDPPEGGERRRIDMTDQLVFDPDERTIAPGDTVVWRNVGNIGHSVTAYEDDIPDDAEYFASGEFDGEQAARDAYTVGDPDSGDIGGDGSYEHTFDVLGTYEYFCIPHESVGMVGSIEVVEGGPDEGGGGPSIPQVPDAAWTLGIATAFTMTTVLALSYFFLKYGGDYALDEGEEGGRTGE
jgi:plastocyanin